MQQRKPQSCLVRLAISAGVFILTTLASLCVVSLIGVIYPSVNPTINDLLISNQVPYAADLTWLFWTLIPGGFSLIFGILLSLLANRIFGRRRSVSGVQPG